MINFKLIFLQLPESWISKHRIILKARETLKRFGLLYSEKLDCLKTVLDRLPAMIKEQRAYEKVKDDISVQRSPPFTLLT